MITAVARALAIAATRLEAQAGLAILDGADAAAARTLVAPPPLGDPRPDGWREVEPSWIAHALAGEDDAVRAIVCSDRDDVGARWLARWFLGALVPMPPTGPATTVGELPGLPTRILVRTLDALGRRQLAHAAGGASVAELAGLAARLPWGRTLAGEIAAVRSLGEDAVGQLGTRTAALRRTAALAWHEPTAPLLAGVRAIAPAVRGDVGAQLAQRLPRVLGLLALVELRGFGAAPPVVAAVSPVELRRAIATAQRG